MKLQPVHFPYFFYGTLMNGGKYYDRIKPFQSKIECAFVHGRLYYNEYLDENGNASVTAALEPVGAQRIRGHIFHALPERALELQHHLDELEFNFHRPGVPSHPDAGGRDRVYLRNIISCYTESGESFLAWCYLYYSAEHPLEVLIDENEHIETLVEFKPITHPEFLQLRALRARARAAAVPAAQ
ncbi:MAG: gamma-glutamylcyclotransferase [Rhodocyclaceae bacterium]|nr:gamma-glutamylcyclotransferase [Rhodocyclaceae bacterium]